MKGKLQEYALWAEIISAIAIVISLFYVGLQLGDNTKATLSASASASSATTQDWYLTIGSNPSSSKIWIRGMSNPETLNEDEWVQFVFLSTAIMQSFQNSYYLAQEGTLDTEVQKAITETLLITKDQPGFKLYWSQRKSTYQESFRNYVDEYIMHGVTSEASVIYENNEKE